MSQREPLLPIEFPQVEQPRVSVVIVTYGAWEWVVRCLDALRANTNPCYEVVLVDNASPDGSADRLRENVKGARLFLNDHNSGFGAGSNQGARAARGELVCFLNSDALVQPGWLEPLVETLADGAGAVVPKLLNLDGSLQEAGGIIGSDGQTRSLGDGGDPGAPEYGFQRRVEYGSAACLLTRRSLFLELGGFDSVYGIGYFEDVDLCFQLSARGLRTVYQPRSTVLHVRAASSSPVEAKRLIEENREVFLARWRTSLKGRPPLGDGGKPAPERHVFACRDATALERILVVCDPYGAFPDPLPVGEFLAALSDIDPDARITLLATSTATVPGSEELRARGIEIASPSDREAWLRARLGHYGTLVWNSTDHDSSWEGLFSRTQPQAQRLLLAEPFENGSQGRRRSIASRKWDLILCGSDEERKALRVHAGDADLRVLRPFSVTSPDSPRFDERLGIQLELLDGDDRTTLRWLMTEIFPSLSTIEPHARVLVDGIPRDLANEPWSGPLIPSTEAAGPPRLKLILGGSPRRRRERILGCIGSGVPFVTVPTSGLDLDSFPAAAVANDAASLLPAMLEVHQNQDLWSRFRKTLLSAARDRFNRRVFEESLEAAMAETGLLPVLASPR